MDRIWLPRYPAGVPSDVDLAAYRSVCDVFEESTAKFGQRAAFINQGSTISYSEMDRLTRNFAAFLQTELKQTRGARVALMLPNVLQYPVALFGVLRAGCAAVNCNPLYTPRELRHQLADSGAEVIVVLENFAWVVEQVVASTNVKHVVVTGVGDLLKFPMGLLVNSVVKYAKRLVPKWHLPGAIRMTSALRSGESRPFERVPLGASDLAFLQYTGGTTGVPKGAMLTHGNIIANLQQAHAWLRPVLEEGRETVVTALPLYHVFAVTANCMLFLKIGASNLLITNPRDIPGFVRELARHRVTAITGVNTLFNALLANPEFAKLDFTPLRVAVAGGMAVQKAVAEKWKQITRRALIEGYGLTETSPFVACNPLDLSEYNGSVGLPFPSTEVAIRDEEDRDVAIGEVGELCVRGPQVMRGYWNKPAETAKVMTSDGFLRTGDLATIDQGGFVRIVDRKKDMIIVSGFKVFPNELEDVLAMCPGVHEAAAFGVPDATSGQAVRVAVVKKDPALTAQDVIRHCREHLTAYKVPRLVEFRDELPKSPIGKVLRRVLSEMSSQAAG
ncbi:MAG TPA: AMP-binding protein [Burkholderiaceae bacterium]|nr:AMP-binding protein [Burkholderiaceae bacterium]